MEYFASFFPSIILIMAGIIIFLNNQKINAKDKDYWLCFMYAFSWTLTSILTILNLVTPFSSAIILVIVNIAIYYFYQKYVK